MKNEKDETKLYGYTETMKLVNFVGNEDLIGKYVKAKVVDVKDYDLILVEK